MVSGFLSSRRGWRKPEEGAFDGVRYGEVAEVQEEAWELQMQIANNRRVPRRSRFGVDKVPDLGLARGVGMVGMGRMHGAFTGWEEVKRTAVGRRISTYDGAKGGGATM